MDNQLKQIFTRRLSQCNQSGLILITYEIFFAYADDAKKAIEMQDREGLRESIRKAQRTIDELINSLDFSYELSKTLYPIYTYCKRELSKVLYEFKTERLKDTRKIMEKLYNAFEEAAKQDMSAPLMQNTQKIYAGMTYGRNNLTESFLDNTHRGFLV